LEKIKHKFEQRKIKMETLEKVKEFLLDNYPFPEELPETVITDCIKHVINKISNADSKSLLLQWLESKNLIKVSTYEDTTEFPPERRLAESIRILLEGNKDYNKSRVILWNLRTAFVSPNFRSMEYQFQKEVLLKYYNQLPEGE
jgi:hypothetical protein